MKYVELFSGIGGMGYGLMQAGMKCVGYCELDSFAHKAFQILHDPEGRMWNAYDVRSVTDDDIRLLGEQRGGIDLIAAGFPCQAFSISGLRKGFQDATRGTLFYEVIRFASILRPKHLLLENVEGLLTHDGGRTFGTIIRTLDELGYMGEWHLCNSSPHTPQDRNRVFIVASLRDAGHSTKIFPLGGKDAKSAKVAARLSHYGNDQMNRVYDIKSIAPTLTTVTGGGREVKIETDDQGIRRLTPMEYFRLQTFPDEWYYTLKQNGFSDAQLYKMAGNAVTPAVAYEIGKRVVAWSATAAANH